MVQYSEHVDVRNVICGMIHKQTTSPMIKHRYSNLEYKRQGRAQHDGAILMNDWITSGEYDEECDDVSDDKANG